MREKPNAAVDKRHGSIVFFHFFPIVFKYVNVKLFEVLLLGRGHANMQNQEKKKDN